MKKAPSYFRIVSEEKEGGADLYLYGFIGQDLWYDEDRSEEALTDLEVVRKIKELEKRHDVINIRINSPGGSVYHGDPIITAIRDSKAEIHTYVDGMAASMAADIWIAGHVRHMSSNSKLMIHSTSSLCWGTARDMLDMAEMLEKFDNAAISVFSDAVGMDEEEVRSRFYDYRDHWFTAKEAQELGLIEKVEDYQMSENFDQSEKMSYKDFLKKFHAQKRDYVEPVQTDDTFLENEIFQLTYSHT